MYPYHPSPESLRSLRSAPNISLRCSGGHVGEAVRYPVVRYAEPRLSAIIRSILRKPASRHIESKYSLRIRFQSSLRPNMQTSLIARQHIYGAPIEIFRFRQESCIRFISDVVSENGPLSNCGKAVLGKNVVNVRQL